MTKTDRVWTWPQAIAIGVLVSVVILVAAYALRGTSTGQIWTIGQPVAALSFSPDGQVVAAGLEDGSIQLRQVASGTLLRTIPAHSTRISALAFSPDGMVLASGDPGAVRLWGAHDGKALDAMTGSTGSSEVLAFSPDSRMLASGGRNGELRLWSIPGGTLQKTVQTRIPSAAQPAYENEYPIASLIFSRDGKSLAVSHYDEEVQKWEVPSGKLQQTYKGYNPWYSDNPSVRDIVVDASLQTVAMTIIGSRNAYTWGLTDGAGVHTWEGNITDIWSVAFSPDGQLVATGGGKSEGYYAHSPSQGDYSIYIWSPVDGGEKARLKGHNADVRSLAWSPNGTSLASGSEDGTIRIWKVK